MPLHLVFKNLLIGSNRDPCENVNWFA